jgi:hypothetical protein
MLNRPVDITLGSRRTLKLTQSRFRLGKFVADVAVSMPLLLLTA